MEMGINTYWEAIAVVLGKVVLTAFALERFLALFFETNTYRERMKLASTDYSPMIALAIALLICWMYDLDLIDKIMEGDGPNLVGIALTAGVVAGGSKAAIKLFQDVMGFGRDARLEFRQLKKVRMEIEVLQAQDKRAKLIGAGTSSADDSAIRASAVIDGVV